MKKTYQVTLPGMGVVQAKPGQNLLELLHERALAPDAPCGGKGACGKCKVWIDGVEALACRTVIDRNMTVEPIASTSAVILSSSTGVFQQADEDVTGNLIAIDLGTTTMVCYLLDASGKELGVASALNPQRGYGADVVTRIQKALEGKLDALCAQVREGLSALIWQVCAKAGAAPASVQRIALVANPCMQQLLMGISPVNLSKVPFAPVLTERKTIPAKDLFPICPNAEFLVVPDISGYVGADTLGCVLSTGMYREEKITLMVDIGTNGEMVLGNSRHMLACSTAAGPALEGANIRFGMRGSVGAIDHVDFVERKPQVHVIGGGKAKGICGSGLIDAVAGMLEAGLLNFRGRILSEDAEVDGERVFYLTEDIYLTQTDIRQVQLAKGAIAAGIELMAKELVIPLEGINQVLLAGAFGNFIRAESACRIGLLPPVLLPKIRAVGNAAGSGAKLLCCSRGQQALAGQLCKSIEFLELAALPEFQRSFGKHTHFPTP